MNLYKSFVNTFGKRGLLWLVYLVIFGAIGITGTIDSANTREAAIGWGMLVGTVLFASLGLFGNFIDKKMEDLNDDIKELYEDGLKKAKELADEASKIIGVYQEKLDKMTEVENGRDKTGRTKSSSEKPSKKP